MNRFPSNLFWRCHSDGFGKHYLHAETLERDEATGCFYGICTQLGDTETELRGAVLRLQQAFSEDYRFKGNRRAGCSYYRNWVGWQ